ncbi:transposase, partial [Lichenihabitans sp. Uapishka_5]|uniref:IS66 family transposase n=1 Tax=Lichenihabitans sp. Uapishka_5 TaxID=3037302 RepID=UPI0029E7EF85
MAGLGLGFWRTSWWPSSCDHLPLYRQVEIFAREGVTLQTSTLSGWVGATAAALMPLVDLLRREVIGNTAVLHGDDTPVPILAPGMSNRFQRRPPFRVQSRPL